MLLVKSKELKNSGKNLFKTGGCALLSLFLSPLSHAQSSSTYNSAGNILSIFLSLLVVVGIIFALAYLMRRFTVTQAGNGQLKVVASMVAGTKEKIMVIQVGDEQHLVGITSHHISHLSKLDNPLEATPQSGNKGSGEQFRQKLVSAMAGKINPAVKGEK
ncbi:flagellar biosynthetic protein FliO [Alteromonas sp. CYL-A6]|uniref:flagellar biosynthetic protein FliO n=1 Tax=Alteromonas nitratireducens TaxID=3390813 RepID=UPI0034B74130